MSRVALRDGQTVEVPDGLNTKGGKQDWLIQQGFTPKQVGLETVETETGGAGQEFLIGVGEFLSDRIPGLGSEIRGPDTLATGLGRAALPVAGGVGAAALTGGTSLGAGLLGRAGVQALTAAGLEAPRQGATTGSIATAGGIGGTASLGGDMAGRVLGSIFRNIGKARGLAKPVTLGEGVKGTPLQTMAQTARGGGGLNFAIKQNLAAINQRVAKVFGFSDDLAKQVDELGDDFMDVARTRVNETYTAAQPVRDVSITKAKAAMQALEKAGVPDADIGNIITRFGDDAIIDANSYQGINRAMRDIRARTAKNPVFGGMVSKVDEAIDALDAAAVDSGADKALMSVANQRYKLLATLQEVNAVLESGEIPAGQLLRKLGRENFKGVGRKTLAEGSGGRLIPEFEDLIKVGKQVARFERETAGGSATAGRQLVTKPLMEALGGLATGKLGAGNALRLGGLTLLPGIAGRAATQPATSGLLTGAIAQPLATRRADEQ